MTWTTLGMSKPRAATSVATSTGVRPAYLRRDDWHISSTYTAEERAAVDDAERAYIDSVTIEMPEDLEEEDLEEDSFEQFEALARGAGRKLPRADAEPRAGS